MNIDQLLDAMASSDPNPDAVLDMVGRKRRAARNRSIYAAASGLAVVVAVVAGVLLHGVSPGAGSRSAAASAGSRSGPAALPAASGLSSGAHSQSNGDFGQAITPGTCTPVALGQILASAVRSGASVIVGTATLDSTPAAHSAGSGSTAYYPVTLSSVRTLAGPAVGPGAVVWLSGASRAASEPATSPPPPSPDSQVFGIVYPSARSRLPGAELLAAPVIGGQVLVSSGGCWDMAAFPAPLPQGLALRPSSPSAGHPASAQIPLKVAEKLAAQA
jgi:hypothetical protein